ncbi:U4/U6.U5 tri-snRNP-associated protein 1 [Fistulifera solaris]|uniref:U4/U6.U5 tri-snRNP-associated protein 1 n=1 Tax=Fistulifera solaris TaxID=1519565 RepID=A0A1Z5JMP6_FISSO|nr:U4/U6.U5 tri-snRNP-associated protein 1 [Fistulifera solaris]|eukprot:GAX15290.1 U4/U6.U5 tri-snRNP-associated protein 1 [Fistulifera solaris]
MSQDQVIEISVEETNALRLRLGLAPLRGTVSHPLTTASTVDSEEAVLEMSVDESNDLRAQLGLPPLRTSENRKVIHAPAVHDGQAKQSAERITAAKLQREVQEGISKFTQNKLEENSTAKAWAARMRSMKYVDGVEATPTTTASSSSINQKQYKERDLDGLKVAHGVDEIVEGSTTVLTLSDLSLLQQDEHRKVVGLNDEEQQLENVQLTERHKIEKGLKEKRRVEMGMGRAGGYAGFDDDEFEELGGSSQAMGPNPTKTRKLKGFQIGAHWNAEEDEPDLFAAEKGKAISLVTKADVTAADFMTAEEEAHEEAMKKAAFKRKDKKKKKEKKSKRKTYDSEDEVENEAMLSIGRVLVVEAVTAHKKRRRSDSEESEKVEDAEAQQNKVNKRNKYEAAVERGNSRTKQMFAAPKKPLTHDEEGEPDDAFLDAALDKARRLGRLKALSGLQRSGAASVVQAVQNSVSTIPSLNGGVEFSIDETREFARALQTRVEQTRREKKDDRANHKSNASIRAEKRLEGDLEPSEELSDMAKYVKDDAPFEGLTGATTSIGRGVGGFLQLLQQTGESALKNGGREEMRGRAKDEKTYEDYERLDLSKVVRLDMNTATAKDKELAQREVKLEYRDSHGRLLTRKEAFRELCYQFHGHGSGKRKEEKKLQQIAREQAEAGAAKQDHTLGALRATQKATGKAFVVHKT